jgi:membrane-associated protease RseP (regulator of RpoE activity)
VSAGVWIFVLAILVVIMVHESGHFFVAKLFGFKATKFFLGFGPTLWSVQRGETEYGVKALPLGGFVKIAGMNPYEDLAPQDRARSYPSKPRWQRALLLLAGSATHWILVFVVLVPTLLWIGLPTARGSNVLYAVQKSSPAVAAGLEPGDRIVEVGGTAADSWPDIRSYIRARGGRTATFVVARDGEHRELSARLWWAIYSRDGQLAQFERDRSELRPLRSGEDVVGFLGVSPEPLYESFGFGEAVAQSGRTTWLLTTRSVQGIGSFFGQVFDGTLFSKLSAEGPRTGASEPIGIVGGARIAGETFERGRYLELILSMCGLVISVAILNLLPLPPLDGGHLAVVAFEAVTRRTVDLRRLIPIAAAVISFFVLVFLAMLYLDLARPIEVPF